LPTATIQFPTIAGDWVPRSRSPALSSAHTLGAKKSASSASVVMANTESLLSYGSPSEASPLPTSTKRRLPSHTGPGGAQMPASRVVGTVYASTSPDPSSGAPMSRPL
jgi:hypothetical protein